MRCNRCMNMEEAMENNLYALKLALVGDSMVGKTSFLLRFSNGHLKEEENLVVSDFAERVEVDGASYHVNFRDINGDLEARVRPLVYPETSLFLLCFDITNRASFENIKESWIPEIRHYEPHTPFLLVGNKIDLRGKSTKHDHESVTVTKQEARELAKLYGTSYIENSAVTGEQVSEVVNTAIRMVIERKRCCRCRRHPLIRWLHKFKCHR